jgi:CheY-like chemotaxis protein
MGPPKTILIVDNDGDVRFAFATALNHDGYNVVEAENGASGVELAQHVLPDLVLMDIRMPRMNGVEATERLRADERTRDIPVVAVTGELRAGTAQAARAEHLFHSIIRKPVTAGTLMQHVHGIIGDATGGSDGTEVDLGLGPEKGFLPDERVRRLCDALRERSARSGDLEVVPTDEGSSFAVRLVSSLGPIATMRVSRAGVTVTTGSGGLLSSAGDARTIDTLGVDLSAGFRWDAVQCETADELAYLLVKHMRRLVRDADQTP